MFKPKIFTCSSVAALHFIKEEKRIVFITQFTCSAQVVAAHFMDAALALDRLASKCDSFVIDLIFQCFNIIERNGFESGWYRSKPF